LPIEEVNVNLLESISPKLGGIDAEGRILEGKDAGGGGGTEVLLLLKEENEEVVPGTVLVLDAPEKWKVDLLLSPVKSAGGLETIGLESKLSSSTSIAVSSET
jgi:hypothetical protein